MHVFSLHINEMVLLEEMGLVIGQIYDLGQSIKWTKDFFFFGGGGGGQ